MESHLSFDWKTIGQKVSSLYEEMEYHCEYTFEQFRDDLKIVRANNARNEKISVLKWRPEDGSTGYLSYSTWISSFRHLIECHRSILTKLFSFTNDLSGVDTLLAYCDYYRSYYEHKPNHIPVVLPVDPGQMFYQIFGLIARTETTSKCDTWQNVWFMLQDQIGYPKNNSSSSAESFVINIPAHDKHSAIVIMADSDLDAAVDAIIRFHCNNHFRVTKFLVQEAIKEQFLSTLQKHDFQKHTPPLDMVLSSLYLFRTIAEVIGNLNGQKHKLRTVSVWSENLIAAKKLAANIEQETVWINTHGQLSPGLHSIFYVLPPYDAGRQWTWDLEYDNINDECPMATKTFDLFYGGKWHDPVKRTYWTNKAGVTHAEATERDFTRCVRAAREGLKSWQSMKLSKRVKVIRCFAQRLRANGELELADLVLELLSLPNEFGHSISIVRDGDAEILTTQEPSAVTGNTVIVASDTGCDSVFVGYCDMLTSSGFPSGVVNYLFARNSSRPGIVGSLVDRVITNPRESFDFKFPNSQEEYLARKLLFAQVTKPKCIWVQCG